MVSMGGRQVSIVHSDCPQETEGGQSGVQVRVASLARPFILPSLSSSPTFHFRKCRQMGSLDLIWVFF